MGGSPPYYWANWALVCCQMLLGMGPLGHMTTLIFCFEEVIAHVRVVIHGLAHLIFPTWTYCFDAKPLLLLSRPITSFL